MHKFIIDVVVVVGLVKKEYDNDDVRKRAPDQSIFIKRKLIIYEQCTAKKGLVMMTDTTVFRLNIGLSRILLLLLLLIIICE